MSELAAAEVINDTEVIETDGQVEDSTADSAPAAVEETEEVSELDKLRAEKAEAQKAVAEKAFKEREARRRADDLESRLKELEAKNNTNFDGVIPEKPDQWDEDFDQKMVAREEALKRQARAEYAAAQQREAEAEAQRKRERDEYEQSQKVQAEFKKNASELGVDQDVLARAAQSVIDYGVTPEIEDVILKDKHGALMLQHLAANPLDLSDLIEADQLSAGMLLAEVKQKSLSLKPKPSNAPPPPDSLDGRGVPSKDRGPSGATFE